ncbi:hypothetical protein Tco_0154894 [Tanacetum coccineum]
MGSPWYTHLSGGQGNGTGNGHGDNLVGPRTFESKTRPPRGAKLLEENKLLKQQAKLMISNGKRPRAATDIDNLSFNPEDQGQSSESVTTNVHSCNGSPSPDDDGSDTSLRLG